MSSGAHWRPAGEMCFRGGVFLGGRRCIPQCILGVFWDLECTFSPGGGIFLVHSWTVSNILENILTIYSDNMYSDNNPPPSAANVPAGRAGGEYRDRSMESRTVPIFGPGT